MLQKNRRYLFGLMLTLLSWHSHGQGCNCPPIATCGSCQGGLTELTLRYLGVLATVEVKDGIGNTLYNGLVVSGGLFSFTANVPGQPFAGGQVTITVALVTNTVIVTSCTPPVFVGSSYGSFMVIDGKSKDGGSLCCSAATMETTDPVISNCPGNIIVNSGASCATSVSWTPPSASDNCGSVSLVGSHSPGSTFSLGTTQVIYTATDDYGNTAQCSFNVTVNDNTKPIINGCPSNITVPANSACQAVVNWTTPVATDNCSATMTSNHKPGDTFQLGTTTVTYTATDGSGNTSTCTFNVTVRDATAPSLTCPADITLQADASCEVQANWTQPIATDCSPVTLTSTHQPGDTFPFGSTTITYTATDEHGNSSICTFNVFVEDNTPPIFQNCPAEVSMTIDNGCEAVVTWTEPSATDNCNVAEVTSTHKPGDSFPPGTTSVEYKATDISGNVTQCKFDVVIRTNVKPVISNCPSDIRVEADPSGSTNVVWENPTTSSTCGEISLTSSHQPNSQFSVGTTTVEYHATDPSGIEATCSFNVIVFPHKPDFEVSAIVTPNGDGVNDEWIVTNIENYRNNKVMIVDRWGSVVYRATGYNNDTVIWKGASTNGALVPTGTYFYTIEVDFQEVRIEKQGFIEVIQ